MTGRSSLPRVITFLKMVALSLLLTLLILFLVATARTFTSEVNVGLQLAQWEKTTYISADISTEQREVLLTNFKGNRVEVLLSLVMWQGLRL